MFEKSRSCQIVTEVEISRKEFNWKTVIDLAEELKIRSYFLIGEGKLELLLQELPPTEIHISKSHRDLTEANDIC
jgi:hypothetical protein